MKKYRYGASFLALLSLLPSGLFAADERGEPPPYFAGVESPVCTQGPEVRSLDQVIVAKEAIVHGEYCWNLYFNDTLIEPFFKDARIHALSFEENHLRIAFVYNNVLYVRAL